MDSSVEELISYARNEIALRREQGCDTWEWERLVALFEEDSGPDPLKRARKLVRSIQGLKPDEDFPYEEPNELPRIRELRPEGPRSIATGLSAQALDEATLGALQGQVAGATLGRPVRGWHRVKVDGLMKVCALEAIDDYLPQPPETGGFRFPPASQGQLRGEVTCGARNAELDLAVVGLRALHEAETGMDRAHLAERWLSQVPYGGLPRPMGAAYRNLVNELLPPDCARERNPWREWVGTMGRGCAWGRARPGRPEQAAELAWRDARISHERNGLYAAMWTAATTSAAFVTDDPARALEVGLSEVPGRCRLAATVTEVQEAFRRDAEPAEVIEDVMKQHRSHSPMHVLSNAAVVAIALLWGGGDFSRSLGLAVSAGQDTSGNAAAAGAICGALRGAAAIPPRWTEPLGDHVATKLAGRGPLSISDLVQSTRAAQNASNAGSGADR
jgi:ADP-ribosylglycohydrolase